MNLGNDRSLNPIPSSTNFPSNEGMVKSNTNVQEGAAVDSQVYEGVDVMSNIVINLQQFIDKSTYNASAQSVNLPPPDPDGQSGPQPFGLAEQRLIRKNYSDRVLKLIAQNNLSPAEKKAIYDALLSGQDLPNGALAALAKAIDKSATDDTREKANLPASWTLNSKRTQDWIPAEVPSYSAEKQTEIVHFYHQSLQEGLKIYLEKPALDPEKIELLQTAVNTGKVSNAIAKEFHLIKEFAGEKVQAAYGLPLTWSPDSKAVDNWKPVSFGIINPQSLANEREEMIYDNLEGLVNGMISATKKANASLPTNDPNQTSILDYLDTIAQALREVKQLMRDKQVTDAEMSQKFAAVKFEKIEERQVKSEEIFQKKREMAQEAAKAEKRSKIFKILGPIIAAVSTVVGAVMTISTLGIAAPAAIALIVVGVAMTTYSIVDSTTGATQFIMTQLSQEIEKAFPGEDNAFIRSVVKFAIIAAVAGALLVAFVATGGGAAANVATQVTTQVAKQAVIETVRQLAFQIAIMSVMSSNAIGELLCTSLVEVGLIDKDDEKAKMWIQIATAVVVMGAVMYSMSKMTKNAEKLANAASKESSGADVAKAGVIADSAKTAAVEGLKGTSSGLSKGLERLLEIIKNTADKLATTMKEIPKRLLEALKKLLEELIQGVASFADKNQKMMSLQKVIQMTGGSLQTADSVIKYKMHMAVHDLLIELGEYEKAQKVAEELIKLLDDTIHNLQSDVEGDSAFLTDLQRTHLSVYQSTSQISRSFKG